MNIFNNADEFVDLDNRRHRNSEYKTTAESLFNKTEAQLPKNLIENKTILDLGSCLSHAGYYSLLNGAKFYTGVEVQLDYSNLGKQLLEKYIKNNNFEIITQDILEFLDDCIQLEKKFDIVLASGIIYGFFNPIELLCKISKVTNETIIIDSKYVVPPAMQDAGRLVIRKKELMPNASDPYNKNSYEGVSTRICHQAISIVLETQGFRQIGGFILPKPIQNGDPYNDIKSNPSGKSAPSKFIVRYDRTDVRLDLLEDIIRKQSKERHL